MREEIALAKAEMTEKVSKLDPGIVVGAVAAVFAVFALIYLLDAALGASGSSSARTRTWIGFLIVG